MLMIKDILDNKSMVNLYTRPRRFGKTLNMSMIQYYFEKAGFTSNDVRFSKAKLENDDRTPEYEIEFYNGAVELMQKMVRFWNSVQNTTNN